MDKSLRRLHNELKITTKFTTWANRAFTAFSIDKSSYDIKEKESTGGRPSIDYIVTDEIYSMIQQREMLKATIGKGNRPEIIFFLQLEEILYSVDNFRYMADVVIYQHKCDEYRVDCYFPNINLAIEYDESYHTNPTATKKDKVRQCYIENKLGCKFIRVKLGQELKGFGEIINEFIERG